MLKIPNKLLWLVAAHCGLFMMAPIFANKIVALGVFGLLASGGIFAAGMSRGLIYVITEVYGGKIAKQAILASMVARAVIFLATIAMVFAPAQSVTPGWERVVSTSIRIFFASEIVHGLHYVMDVPIFTWMRKKLQLWSAYNVSAVITLMASHATFTFLAHSFTGKNLYAIFAGGLVVRWAAGMALTPVVTLLVKWARKDNECTV